MPKPAVLDTKRLAAKPEGNLSYFDQEVTGSAKQEQVVTKASQLQLYVSGSFRCKFSSRVEESGFP